MVLNTTQFQKQCVHLIQEVHDTQREIVITKRGKPLAKLVAVQDERLLPFIGSLTGVGQTTGDLLEPVEAEWEVD